MRTYNWVIINGELLLIINWCLFYNITAGTNFNVTNASTNFNVTICYYKVECYIMVKIGTMVKHR